MRNYTIIVSVTLNAALLILFLWLHLRPAPSVPASTSPDAAPGARVLSDGIAPPLPPAVTLQPPLAGFHWRTVESEDFREYIANLRAIGCPEETLVDLIVPELDEIFLRKLLHSISPRFLEPWEAREHQKWQRTRRALSPNETEKREVLVELLGPSALTATPQLNTGRQREMMLSFLPSSKRTMLHHLLDEHSDETSALHRRAHGILIDEDHVRLAELARAAQSRLAALLSPAELDELHCRAQIEADVLDDYDFHLEGITLTGVETRRIWQLSTILKDVVETHWMKVPDPSEEEVQRQRREFEDQVIALLGPARVPELLRAQEKFFRETMEFARDHKLSRSTALELYDACKRFQAEAQRLQSSSIQPAHQHKTAMEQIGRQAVARVMTLLGTPLGRNYLGEQQSWFEELLNANRDADSDANTASDAEASP